MKFDLQTFKETTAPSGADFSAASGSGNSCNNVVLEAHFRVYFAPLADAADRFVIKEVLVDTVYGDNVPDYSLSTSVTYLAWDSEKE